MENKKYEAERQGHYVGTKLTVMQPTVINESNVPREVPLENVASDGETAIDNVNLDYQREEEK